MLISKGMLLEEAWSLALNELNAALTTAGNHPFRFASLATVDNHGAPHLRTVVLREFHQSGRFVIFTDKRSEKVNHIRQHNRVSLLFYDDRSGLQLRANGPAEVVDSGDELARYWSERGSKNPFSYTSVPAPGTPIEHPEEAWEWNDEDASHFCFIRVDADLLEFLQLDGIRHLRAEMIVREAGQQLHPPTLRWIAP